MSNVPRADIAWQACAPSSPQLVEQGLSLLKSSVSKPSVNQP